MPNKSEKRALRFQMDSEVFASIWANHIAHPKADEWRTFVINCFNRFSEPSEPYNINTLNSDPDTEGWIGWDDDKKYQYLSERCYAKCMALRAKFKKDTGKVIPMPEGYKSRKGTKASKRITSERLAEIFSFD